MTGIYTYRVRIGPLAHGGSYTLQPLEPKSPSTSESTGASASSGIPAIEADDLLERMQPSSIVSTIDLDPPSHPNYGGNYFLSGTHI